MEKDAGSVPYILYILLMAIFILGILYVPILSMQGSPLVEYAYPAFHYTCHQINSRSLCLFQREGGLSVEDCTSDSTARDFRMTPAVVKEGEIGYKLPVCARDIGIYAAMLLGGIAYAFFGKVGRTSIPNKWIFVLALVPMALDGGSQFLGLRESSNLLRILTGGLAGFVVPFYLVPVLNEIWMGIFKRHNK